jgi:hypothetical protein
MIKGILPHGKAPKGGGYLSALRIVFIVLTANYVCALLWGNIYALVAVGFCIVALIGAPLPANLNKFRAEDKANFYKIVDFCLENGYTVNRKQPKFSRIWYDGQAYGNGVNRKEVWYFIGLAKDPMFILNMNQIAEVKKFNKGAFRGKVAIMMKADNEEAELLYGAFYELLGESGIVTKMNVKGDN